MASLSVTIYITIIFTKRFIEEFRGVNILINKSLIKEYFLFNMKTFLSTTLKAGNNNIDNLILGYFTDTKTVGIYQTLKNILMPVNFIATPFSMMTVSKLTKLYEENKILEFKNLIKIITFKIFKIAIVVSIIIYIVLPYILEILKIENSYQNIFILLIIYSLLILLLWWSRIFATIVNPMMSIYGGIYMLIHNVTITILLTKLYGLYGLIISIVILFIIMNNYFIIKLGELNARKI